MEIHDVMSVDRVTFAHRKRRAPTDRLPIPKMRAYDVGGAAVAACSGATLRMALLVPAVPRGADRSRAMRSVHATVPLSP